MIETYVKQLKACLFEGDEQGFLDCVDQIQLLSQDDVNHVQIKLLNSFGLFSFRSLSTDRALIKEEKTKRYKMLFDWLPLSKQLDLLTSVDFETGKDVNFDHVSWLKMNTIDIHKNTKNISLLCQFLIQSGNIEVLEAFFRRASHISHEFTPQFFLTLPVPNIYFSYKKDNARGSFLISESRDDSSFVVASSVWWSFDQKIIPFLEQYKDILNLNALRNVLNDEYRSQYSFNSNQDHVDDYMKNKLPILDSIVTRQILDAQCLNATKIKSVKKM